MNRKPLKILPQARVLLLAAVSAAMVFAPFGNAAAEDAEPLPIVFVHGLAGSGQQYQTQAMRFASNGYPDDRIRAFEWNSGSILNLILIPFGILNSPLTSFIDSVRAEFGVDRVILVGHSMGCTVSNVYLNAAARANRVAKYIGIDGASNATCGISGPTAHMECMGIFAGTTGDVGGNNVYLAPQTHVEVVTSEESFLAQYEFVTGEPPYTSLILPEPPGQVQISGRVVNFPANSGVAGATLEIWEVNTRTGYRKYDTPVASHPIPSTGDWGPVLINGQQRYEFLIKLPGRNDFHIYVEETIRSSRLVRLLFPTLEIEANTNSSDYHAAAAILRNREFWANHPSGANDLFTIKTTKRNGQVLEPPVDVFTNVTANNILGVHVHDAAATPGYSSLNLLPYFPSQPFQTGVDVFMPSATSPPRPASPSKSRPGATRRGCRC